MDWFHRVDPDWLSTRKLFLCASDISKLIPITATGRPRSNMTEAHLKVWAEKQSNTLDSDTISRGAMARGHVLEPYAIEAFNELNLIPEKLYHWDDKIIHDKRSEVSCSPDATDIPMQEDMPVLLNSLNARVLGEVKSYSASAHYSAGFADKMELEERWQIAVAFKVMPSLEKAVLIFYNPNTAHPIFYFIYERNDLLDELKMIDAATKTYYELSRVWNKDALRLSPSGYENIAFTEEQIIEAEYPCLILSSPPLLT